MRPYLAFWLGPWLLRPVLAAPSVNYPLNSQLPPVARLDEPWSFTFSPVTFKSSESTLAYSLVSGPSWLTLDSDTRKLSGTPAGDVVPSGDVVGIPVQIQCEDSTGSVTMDATIVVSRKEAPKVQSPITDQIETLSPFSAPSSILLHPATDFKVPFAATTFTKPAASDVYLYATSGDGSPLPAWIQFDAKSLTFSGRTPPLEALVNPPQSFDLQLTASEVQGFSSVGISFSLVVTDTIMTTEHSVLSLQATRDEAFSNTDLQDSIKLEGQAISPDKLTVSTTNFPGWLTIDKSLELKGTPPADAQSVQGTITLKDDQKHVLNVLVLVRIAHDLFTGLVPSLKAVPGQDFDLDLEPYLARPGETDMTLGSVPSWITYHGFKIMGTAPTGPNQELQIPVQVSSKDGAWNETRNLSLSVAMPTMSIIPYPGATEASDGSTTGDVVAQRTNSGLSKKEITLAIVLPSLFALFMIFSLAFCLWRRKRDRDIRVQQMLANGGDPSALALSTSYVLRSKSNTDQSTSSSSSFGMPPSSQDKSHGGWEAFPTDLETGQPPQVHRMRAFGGASHPSVVASRQFPQGQTSSTLDFRPLDPSPTESNSGYSWVTSEASVDTAVPYMPHVNKAPSIPSVISFTPANPADLQPERMVALARGPGSGMLSSYSTRSALPISATEGGSIYGITVPSMSSQGHMRHASRSFSNPLEYRNMVLQAAQQHPQATPPRPLEPAYTTTTSPYRRPYPDIRSSYPYPTNSDSQDNVFISTLPPMKHQPAATSRHAPSPPRFSMASRDHRLREAGSSTSIQSSRSRRKRALEQRRQIMHHRRIASSSSSTSKRSHIVSGRRLSNSHQRGSSHSFGSAHRRSRRFSRHSTLDAARPYGSQSSWTSERLGLPPAGPTQTSVTTSSSSQGRAMSGSTMAAIATVPSKYQFSVSRDSLGLPYDSASEFPPSRSDFPGDTMSTIPPPSLAPPPLRYGSSRLNVPSYDSSSQSFHTAVGGSRNAIAHRTHRQPPKIVDSQSGASWQTVNDQ